MTALPPDPLRPVETDWDAPTPQVSLGVRLWLAGAILVALGIVVLVVTLRGAS